MTKKLIEIKEQVREENPLIHCITNHISIADCANAILAVGAIPIMAEHPDESGEITARAKALLINLGNINEERMKAILHSGKIAYKNKIPIVIDLVGIGCSELRIAFAKRFISRFCPEVIKGNLSEIKAICGCENSAEGVNVGRNEKKPDIEILKQYAKSVKAVIVITGKIDIIIDGKDVYYIKNGCKMMSLITGTGCVLGALITAFISQKSALNAAVLAAAFIGICGELAENSAGPASFKTAMFDNLYILSDKEFIKNAKISKNEE